MKGCAADSGTGDDVSTPPFGPGSELPSFREPAGADSPLSSSSRSPKATPLAAAALLVCIAAFVLGLVPAFGAVLGAVGIVLVALAARRGESTGKTLVGGVLAGLAVLASATTTILLVGALAFSSTATDPEPVVEAPVAADENDGETEPVDDPVEPTSTPSEEPTSEESTSEPEQTTETASTPESTPESTPAEAPAADLSEYEELDERTLAQIVKAPDDHIGRQVVLYGAITQLDAATGPCFVRISISHAPQDEWYDYEHNSVGFAGDGESDCPVLDPLVADDEVKLWVTIGGSISYDTQIGGSTTVPAYIVDDAELL